MQPSTEQNNLATSRFGSLLLIACMVILAGLIGFNMYTTTVSLISMDHRIRNIENTYATADGMGKLAARIDALETAVASIVTRTTNLEAHSKAS